MPAVREKGRKEMVFLFARRVERCEWRRGAAALADPQQAAEVPEDDVAVAIPRSAHGDAAARQIAQGLRQAARHVQFLEPAAGIERHEPSVRRPERRRRDAVELGTGQRPDFQ